MKKITLLLSFCALFLLSNAQLSATSYEKGINLKNLQHHMGAKEEGDTLLLTPDSFVNGTPTVYNFIDQENNDAPLGYVFGPNVNNFTAAAQVYEYTNGYTVVGASLWIVDNTITEGDLIIEMLDADLSTTLASVSIPFDQVTRTTGTEGDFLFDVVFDEPVQVTGEYALAANWSADHWPGADSLPFGLIHTTPGDANGADLAFIEYNGSLQSADALLGGFDVDAGIFALITEAPPLNVTFNLDISKAEVVETDRFFVSGDFNNWAVPGLGNSTELLDDDNDGIYSASIQVGANTGAIEYRYYQNIGYDNPDPYPGAGTDGKRILEVLEEDVVVDDIWDEFKETSAEEKALSLIGMYPNPFNNQINLTGLNNISKVAISNVVGQTIQTNTVDAASMTLNTADLESGIYVVTFVTENGLTRSERIVKK